MFPFPVSRDCQKHALDGEGFRICLAMWLRIRLIACDIHCLMGNSLARGLYIGCPRAPGKEASRACNKRTSAVRSEQMRLILNGLRRGGQENFGPGSTNQ